MGRVKKAVLDLVKKLPDDCSLEDVQYQLYVRQKVERSMLAAVSGRVTKQASVTDELAIEGGALPHRECYRRSPVMTGVALANRIAGVHGGEHQHGRTARSGVGGGGALPIGGTA